MGRKVHGKWVKFKPNTPILGVDGDKPQITEDGKTVGILHGAGVDPIDQTPIEPAVYIVKPDGTDLLRIDRDLNRLVRVSVPPDSVVLERCIRADIPAARLVDMPADWEPRGGVDD